MSGNCLQSVTHEYLRTAHLEEHWDSFIAFIWLLGGHGRKNDRGVRDGRGLKALEWAVGVRAGVGGKVDGRWCSSGQVTPTYNRRTPSVTKRRAFRRLVISCTERFEWGGEWAGGR